MTEATNMGDGIELLPCPFCGGRAEIEPKNWAGRDYIGVFCTECLIFQDSRSPDDASAIAAWNTRPLEPTARQPADDVVERIAEEIYEAMRWAAQRAENGAPPPWTPGGNSNAQQRARQSARALSVLPTDERLREAAQMSELKERLYLALKHGDDDHQAWLLDALDAFFLGRPIPAPRGAGRKEARIEQLEAEVRRLRETVKEAELGLDAAARTLNGGDDAQDAIQIVRSKIAARATLSERE